MIKKIYKSQDGFSLTELMVALVIIGVLVLLALPRLMPIVNKAKATEAKLTNENFVTKAKPEVVAQAREKLAQLTEQLETVTKHLLELEQS